MASSIPVLYTLFVFAIHNNYYTKQHIIAYVGTNAWNTIRTSIEVDLGLSGITLS